MSASVEGVEKLDLDEGRGRLIVRLKLGVSYKNRAFEEDDALTATNVTDHSVDVVIDGWISGLEVEDLDAPVDAIFPD